jgi:hypothetical protein
VVLQAIDASFVRKFHRLTTLIIFRFIYKFSPVQPNVTNAPIHMIFLNLSTNQLEFVCSVSTCTHLMPTGYFVNVFFKLLSALCTKSPTYMLHSQTLALLCPTDFTSHVHADISAMCMCFYRHEIVIANIQSARRCQPL